MASKADFALVFARLRAILGPYTDRMHVSADGPLGFGLDLAPEGARGPTTWFAGVRLGKAYVSYYLMPVYVEPSLLDGMTPTLRRRKHGKCCFNFTKVDETLFEELGELTRAAFARTAGDPAWGARRRQERGMAHRRAMSAVCER